MMVKILGVLTYKGRLTNADLDPDAKEPLILPKDHYFTKLIVTECLGE